MIKQIALITIILVNIVTSSQMFAMNNLESSLYGKDPFRFGEIDIHSTISSQERSKIEQFKCSQSVAIPGSDYISSRKLLAYALKEDCNAELKDSILVKAVYLRDYYLVQQALLCKANPNANDYGDPIIAKANNLDIIKLLVAHGASLPYTHYLLHRACSADCDWPLLQYYINQSVYDINGDNCQSLTPLHEWAFCALGTGSAREENIPSAQKKLRLLLDAGADPTLKDDKDCTALDILQSEIQYKENKSAYSGLIETLETAEKKYNEKQVSS